MKQALLVLALLVSGTALGADVCTDVMAGAPRYEQGVVCVRLESERIQPSVGDVLPVEIKLIHYVSGNYRTSVNPLEGRVTGVWEAQCTVRRHTGDMFCHPAGFSLSFDDKGFASETFQMHYNHSGFPYVGHVRFLDRNQQELVYHYR